MRHLLVISNHCDHHGFLKNNQFFYVRSIVNYLYFDKWGSWVIFATDVLSRNNCERDVSDMESFLSFRGRKEPFIENMRRIPHYSRLQDVSLCPLKIRVVEMKIGIRYCLVIHGHHLDTTGPDGYRVEIGRIDTHAWWVHSYQLTCKWPNDQLHIVWKILKMSRLNFGLSHQFLSY